MHLDIMRVDLPRHPIKKATPLLRAVPSNPDEAHSSAPASSAPPSFMHASLRNIIQEELEIFERSMVKKVVEAMEAKVNLMLPVMERHNVLIKTNLEALVQRVSNLEESVNNLKTSPHVPSTSAQEPAPSDHIGTSEAQMDPVLAVVAVIEKKRLKIFLLISYLLPLLQRFPLKVPLLIQTPLHSNPSSDFSSHQLTPNPSSLAPESSLFLLSPRNLPLPHSIFPLLNPLPLPQLPFLKMPKGEKIVTL